MQIKKLNPEHYILVSTDEISEGDLMYNSHTKGIAHAANSTLVNYGGCFKILGSTKVDIQDYWKTTQLELSEIKELIGETIDSDKADEILKSKWCRDNENLSWLHSHTEACIIGYEKALEDNKDKVIVTNQKLWDIAKIIVDKMKVAAETQSAKLVFPYLEEDWFDFLEEELKPAPKDSWDVEFDENKNLKLCNLKK